MREEELNFNSQVPPGNKLVILCLAINIILLECDTLADPIIEGLQQIQRELLNQLQFHREFQETVSSRQEISGRLREANSEGSQKKNSEETSSPPTSTPYSGTSEENEKEVRKLKRVMKCVFTFPVAGPRTPSLTLTRKKATPRRGSLKPSTPRVLTQFFYVINLVITSIILVIFSNSVNSVKLIM